MRAARPTRGHAYSLAVPVVQPGTRVPLCTLAMMFLRQQNGSRSCSSVVRHDGKEVVQPPRNRNMPDTPRVWILTMRHQRQCSPWYLGALARSAAMTICVWVRHDGFTADSMEFKSWRQFIGSSRGDMACHRSRSQCHACTGLRCCGRPATLDFWDRAGPRLHPWPSRPPRKCL